jgi:hypothetical protein
VKFAYVLYVIILVRICWRLKDVLNKANDATGNLISKHEHVIYIFVNIRHIKYV